MQTRNLEVYSNNMVLTTYKDCTLLKSHCHLLSKTSYVSCLLKHIFCTAAFDKTCIHTSDQPLLSSNNAGLLLFSVLHLTITCVWLYYFSKLLLRNYLSRYIHSIHLCNEWLVESRTLYYPSHTVCDMC